jgi:cytochrome c5
MRRLLVSKADDHFFNLFSVVIGILVAIALLLFALARFLGTPFEDARAESDPEVRAQIAERVAPIGRVAVAGQDNSALAIVAATRPTEAAGAGPAVLPESAEAAYQAACAACHAAGIAGAPASDDRAAWAPRIAQGQDVLYRHAIEGFQGAGGVMPAKGGRTDWPDELIREIVDYMVAKNQ